MSEPLFIAHEGIDDFINRFHEKYSRFVAFYNNLNQILHFPENKAVEKFRDDVLDLEIMSERLAEERFEDHLSIKGEPLQSYVNRAIIGGIAMDSLLNADVFLSDTSATTLIKAAKKGNKEFVTAIKKFTSDTTDYMSFKKELQNYFKQKIIQKS